MHNATKSIFKETILLFLGITLFSFVLEVGYDLIKGHSFTQAIDEWMAQNTRVRSLIIRLIIAFGVAYFGILRKEAKVKKQSKAA